MWSQLIIHALTGVATVKETIMVAKTNAGLPAVLPGATVAFLEGTTSGTVTALSYNQQGSYMTITLSDGSTYKIADTNVVQFNNFKFQCGL